MPYIKYVFTFALNTTQICSFSSVMLLIINESVKQNIPYTFDHSSQFFKFGSPNVHPQPISFHEGASTDVYLD